MMSQSFASTLFQSRTRTAVLDLLFNEHLRASSSELARRAGLSPRSVSREIQTLRSIGLVNLEVVGNSDLVEANERSLAGCHIRALLSLVPPRVDPAVLGESLAFHGAPLAGARPIQHFGFEETFLRGLEAARLDALIVRVLPVVLARNPDPDWEMLRRGARSRKLKAELGFFVELTGQLTGRPVWAEHVASLHDRRRRRGRFLPEIQGKRGRAMAQERSPSIALRWGFWTNATEDVFRDFLVRHHVA